MKPLAIFKLEDYLSKYEFRAPYLFCCSDPETWSQKKILEMADEECLNLWDNLTLGYTEVQGHPLLLEEIEKNYPNLLFYQMLVNISLN